MELVALVHTGIFFAPMSVPMGCNCRPTLLAHCAHHVAHLVGAGPLGKQDHATHLAHVEASLRHLDRIHARLLPRPRPART
eukprot:7253573-Alexandrium_andersonii.AAC.1